MVVVSRERVNLSALGGPFHRRILGLLSDGRARTCAELAAAAHGSPAAVDSALARLCAQGLLRIAAHGRHRYYALADGANGARLRASVQSVDSAAFPARTPAGLRAARACYGHAAGALGVAVHDRMLELGWLVRTGKAQDNYALTLRGDAALARAGVDVSGARVRHPRFAYACLDCSERRLHLGGALGRAWLDHALRRRWVIRVAGSRALHVTTSGRRELQAWMGVRL